MTKVHCTVGNCEYWEESNYCSADEILITAVPIRSDTNAMDEHGRNAEKLTQTPAEMESGTLCYTFEARD